MNTSSRYILFGIISRMRGIPLIGYFFEKSFFHYFWVSCIFAVGNIFLLWLFIDILRIPTLISSTVVIGGTFMLRYVLFRVTKIL